MITFFGQEQIIDLFTINGKPRKVVTNFAFLEFEMPIMKHTNQQQMVILRHIKSLYQELLKLNEN